MTGVPATMQPQLTGMPVSTNGAMQPQVTGMPNMGLSNGMPSPSLATSLQPQLTGMPSPAMNHSMGGGMPSPSNPFSQMTTSNNETSNNVFANRFAMPQRSQTAPEFTTLPQQPSLFSSSPQIPQQQQQQPNTMMPFAMANQTTGFSTMQNPAATTTTTNNNPWAGSSFF
ncbi:hypothetical protein K492DRAFT_37572 [Lichtheimia hyalospora FSU 10163]|nr:hypothetical protein K492DRAFT_37572 [Lichtheimia hyalospora FSU 10163]